jgi:hypothetical protein
MLSVVLARLVTLLRRTWAGVWRRRQPLLRSHQFNDFKIAFSSDIRVSNNPSQAITGPTSPLPLRCSWCGCSLC